jgi:hypothetical protein
MTEETLCPKFLSNNSNFIVVIGLPQLTSVRCCKHKFYNDYDAET